MSELLTIFDSARPTPEADVPSAAPLNGPAAGAGQSAHLSFSIAELRELGCHAATHGAGSPEPWMARLRAIAKARRESIEKEYRSRVTAPEESIAELVAERDAMCQALGLATQTAYVGVIESEMATLDAAIRDAILGARAERREVELQRRRAISDLEADLDKARLSGRIQYAQLVLESLRKDRAANQAEIERQADRVQALSSERQEQLARLRRRMVGMDDAGVTRHVAGFLIWATSASLLGAGVAVSQILQHALSASVSPGKQDSLLSEWVKAVHSPLQLLQLFGWFTAIIAAAVGVIGAVAWVSRLWAGGGDRSEWSAWRRWRKREGCGRLVWLAQDVRPVGEHRPRERKRNGGEPYREYSSDPHDGRCNRFPVCCVWRPGHWQLVLCRVADRSSVRVAQHRVCDALRLARVDSARR